MEPFFEFAQHYWWMVFPLFGVGMAVLSRVAGIRSSSERQRHKQELEKLEAERRIIEAGGSSRFGAVGAVGTNPAAIEQPAAASTRDQLADLFAAQDAVTARWMDYELDVAKLIAFPAMSDGRQPLTAAFLVAKRTADTLRPARVDAPMDPDRLTAYRNAVTAYGAAFDLAENDARRMRDSGFEPAERARLERASRLLRVAIDESATGAERQLAYRRVRDEIDGLIVLSPQSISLLETRVGREIAMPASPAGDGHTAPPANHPSSTL